MAFKGPESEEMRRIDQLLQPWVESAPERVAVIDHDRREIDYRWFSRAVDEAVSTLRESGVRGGDRVQIVAENSLALLAMMFASSRLDAWAVPVNARMTALEIERIRDHATPRVQVFTTEASPKAAALLADHFKAGPDIGGAFGRVRIAGPFDCAPELVSDAAEEQVAALIYTTGTTGAPKGVMLTHGNLLYISGASQKARGLTSDDHVVGVLPVTHIFALGTVFLASVRAGALIELHARFDPEMVFQALTNGGSVMPAVPAMHPILFNHLREKGIDRLEAPRLRYLSTGGAPLDPDWKRRVEAFYGVTLHNGYGLTEASPTVAVAELGVAADDLSCGPVLAEQEVRIVPAPGRDGLDENGVGEVLIRGPNIMKGYYRNPEETARVLDEEGFLHTGDLGRIDEKDHLWIVGRCKELIIRSGFNVYPPEVEAALNTHPAVTQASVVGRQVEYGNEEVLAFVQKVPGTDVDEADLSDYVRERLAPYKRPSRIVVADHLPCASTGKVLKHMLLETFAGQI